MESEGRLRNDDTPSQISLSELNNNLYMLDGKKGVNDGTFVNKMCSMICCCLTGFNRPEENGHEYNNVPISNAIDNPPDYLKPQSKKRS